MSSSLSSNGPSDSASPANHVGGRGHPVSLEVRQEILRQVAAGRKALDVAREFGVHSNSISRWKALAKAAGFTPSEPAYSPSPSSPATPARSSSFASSSSSPAASPPVDQQSSSPPPPRETGRYSTDFKRDVLAQVRSGRKIVEVARQYGLPEGTVGRWKKEAADADGELPEPSTTRPHTSGPSPIDPEHRALVLALKEAHPNMGLAQVQNQLKRFHALRLSRQMIGRIFKDAGIPLQKKAASSEGADDPRKNRFEMSRPNELWAIDFKEFWIHSEKAWALFILDDFSRFCLGFALTQKPGAELAIDTVERAIARYGRPERILSDRGPQFHAWNGVSRFDEFLASLLVDHTVTKAAHPFTNGKIEAFNGTVETELLAVEEFASLSETAAALKCFVERYNFERTHMGIDGLVPADRYFGMVAEAQQALRNGLEHAGSGLQWLRTLVSTDARSLRHPTLLELVVDEDDKIELVVLGRRFTLG